MCTREEHSNNRSKKALERRLSPEWNEWAHYTFLVRSATLKNYRKYTDIIDPQRIRSYSNHIDHIISVAYCFKNGISADLCSSIENLQMSTAKNNCIKGEKLTDAARELLLKWNQQIVE